MPNVLCAGLIAADLVFDVAEHPQKGSKMRADGARMIGGGGARNAAVAVSVLGGRASLAGAIGADPLGQFLQETLSANNVDTSYLQVLPDQRTASSAILITPDGERTIVNHRNAALYTRSVALPDSFPFDAVLCDTRWPAGAADIMRAARAAGKPAVIDAEAPVLHAREALELASHVAFSEQGLSDYVGACDAEALRTAGQRLGAWVAVTRGPLPVLCFDGTDITEVPGFPVTAVDTLGAGDVWHGAFTLGLAKGLPAAEAIRHANAAAALKVSRTADQPPVPTEDEVAAFLAQHK